MCGIAGILPFHQTSPAALEARLARMTACLTHRGPDEAGSYATPHVALGSRRLKVIDLATGRMPVANESGSVQVVYNGEIYNYRTLRKALVERHHRLATSSDSEVLPHLFEDFGVDLVQQLVGMFAFALWDGERRALHLVRDRLGIKPLYYHLGPDELLFASELKALLAAVRQEPVIDPVALAEYLALGYIRAPRTIFSGFLKLPPGCALVSQVGSTRVYPYWEFPAAPADPSRDPSQAIDALDQLLHTAVKDRLVADVPLGAFLSGGIDSSLVVALAAAHTSGPVKTFSVGFEDDGELQPARLVAERYGTDHHEIRLPPASTTILERLAGSFDEPFGDNSAVATYFVSELARQHVTVSLSGDGGDELFAGYDRYAHDARWRWLDAVPASIRRWTSGVAIQSLSPGAYGWNFLRALGGSREQRYARYVTQELDPALGGLLTPDLYGGVTRVDTVLAERFHAARQLPFLARLLYVDATTYLPDDILTKVDRMSMAHSLEARVPLLDHRLVEFAARLPVAWKLRRGERKWILKQVAARYLPPEVVFQTKRGFGIPIHRWLRRECAGALNMLVAPEAHSARFLHRPTVRRLIAEHIRSRRDHSAVLWRLLALEWWLRRHHGSEPYSGSHALMSVPAPDAVVRA